MLRVRNPPECHKMQFTDLNEDLVDHILTSLSDFNSLASAIRVSKAIHRVFQTHPSSIVHAVAQNAAGPPLAFPAALRFTRKQLLGPDDWEGDITDFDAYVPNAGPDEVTTVQQPINRTEAEQLVKNGKVVRALEDVFSWRCKDRRSSSSRLSPEESMRFHRAAYRFWLFCETYCVYPQTTHDDSELEVNHSEHHAQFLRSFSAEELLETRRVADFCTDLVGCVSRFQLDDTIFVHWMCEAEMGPEAVLEIYNRQSSENAFMHDSAFFWDAYERVIAEKLQTTAQAREERLAQAILREVYGEHDTCHRCHAVCGLKLYGKTNWHCMRGAISWQKLRRLLPGYLPPNTYEELRLGPRVRTPDGFARMMDELFDAQYAPPAQMHAPGAGPWDAEGLYCAACVEVLLGERLWVWCDAQQQLELNSVREDCWYGWRCRTQAHNYGHAQKLNHFCMPARDDGEDLRRRRA